VALIAATVAVTIPSIVAFLCLKTGFLRTSLSTKYGRSQ
jgi:hypothetical protein